MAAGGGEPNVCGCPKFGLPWQIVPGQIWDWLNGNDPAMVQRVTSKVWAMEKLVLRRTRTRGTSVRGYDEPRQPRRTRQDLQDCQD